MRLPKFDYRQPASIQEACTILLEQPCAKVLAGGTDLLVNMKHRVEAPTMIVSLKGLREPELRQEGRWRLKDWRAHPPQESVQRSFCGPETSGSCDSLLLRRIVSPSDNGYDRRESMSADPMQVLQPIQMVAEQQVALFQSRWGSMSRGQQGACVLLNLLR